MVVRFKTKNTKKLPLLFQHFFFLWVICKKPDLSKTRVQQNVKRIYNDNYPEKKKKPWEISLKSSGPVFFRFFFITFANVI